MRIKSAVSMSAIILVIFSIFFSSVYKANAEVASNAEVSPGVMVLDPSNSGAASATMPIEVPPGRNGITPKLALAYNSNMRNGWLGMGWSLDMGAIQRSTKHGLNYNGNDYVFVDNGSGSDLVPRGDWGTDYYSEKILKTFARFRLTTGGWEMTTKDGTTYYYGKDPVTNYEALQKTSSGKTFKWCLVRVQDTSGNYMTVKYWTDNGEIYLDRIDYTGNGSGNLPTTNYVKFYHDDGSRTDAPTMYSINAPVKTRYRLKTIYVSANNSTARVYKLSYGNSSATGRSLLASVQQFGYDAVVDSSTGDITNENIAPLASRLPAMKFDYTHSTVSFVKNPGDVPIKTTSGVPVYFTATDRWLNYDLNGDGKTDIIQISNNNNFVRISVYSPTTVGSTVGYTQTWTGDTDQNWSSTDGWLIGDAVGSWGGYASAGRTDIIQLQNNNGVLGMTIYEWTGSAFAKVWSRSDMGSGSDAKYWLTGDATGDGRTSIIRLWDNGYCMAMDEFTAVGSESSIVGYSHVWIGPDDWRLQFDANFPNVVWLTGDMDGDGKTDIIRLVHNENSQCLDITGFQARSDAFGFSLWWANCDYSGVHCTDLGYQAGAFDWLPIDVNGDGKTDVVQLYSVQGILGMTVLESDGLKYFKSSDYTTNVGNGLSENTYLTGDVNGDGKTDIVRTSWKNYQNGTWELGIDTFLSDGTRYTQAGPTQDMNRWPGGTLLTGDVNGDGKTDIIHLFSTNCQSNSCQLGISTYLSDGPVPDLLNKVTNSLGGTTEISYAPSSGYMNDNMHFVIQSVASVTVNPTPEDPQGITSKISYTYSGGEYDAAEREFRGFRNVKATGPTNTVWTMFHQDDVFKGQPIWQGISASATNWNSISETLYTRSSASPYTGVYYQDHVAVDNYIWDGASSSKNIYTYFQFDSYGNITEKHTYGDDASSPQRNEYTEYSTDPALLGKWIVAFPSHTYVTDSTGNKIAQTWYTPDTSNGNLLSQELWLNGGVDPKFNFTYEYGNLKTFTDGKGACPTTISYYSADNPTYTYPVKITNCLTPSQSVSITYDEKFGKPTKEVDPNGNPTTHDYDKFGRLINDTTQNVGDLAFKWKDIYYDGLGRAVETARQGPGVNDISQRTIYDQRGNIAYSSLPYFDGLETEKWTHYEYDPIGRVQKITRPDGANATATYAQLRTTLVDENKHQMIQEKDLFGRLVKVEEYTGDGSSAPYALYAKTTYRYDALGNLTDIYDAKNYDSSGNWTGGGSHTQIYYDTLSRKYRMDDPDMGTWYYYYDANGNLASQTDAKNQTIYFQYDALNRIRQKDYGTQKPLDSGDVVYKYDSDYAGCTSSNLNPVGRLTLVTDGSGSEKYCYDALGDVTTVIKTVNGSSYPSYRINATYDDLQRIKSLTYPDNETVNYEYDEGSNLSAVTGYATFTNYNALGQAQNIAYNNGVSTIRQHYATNGRLFSITTNGTQQTPNGPQQVGLQNLAYYYDNVGNITSINDLMPGGPRSQGPFIYDDLNRLTQAQGASYGTITYSFDRTGNMTLNSQVGAYTYGTKPHAVLQAGPNSYGYDANGNMTSRKGVLITYDYDNMPTSTNGNTFAYDYSGQRVKKNSTVYIGKLYECFGTSCSKHIFAGDARIVTKSGPNTYFYLTDHLGSGSVITDQSGKNVENISYYPFGGINSDTGSDTGNVNMKYKYTGQESDLMETGLYYYNARYYDADLGRFCSADSIVQDPNDPQSFNRYSYVGNNPLGFIDPSGHDLVFNNPGSDGGGITVGVQPGTDPNPFSDLTPGGGNSGGSGGGAGGNQSGFNTLTNHYLGQAQNYFFGGVNYINNFLTLGYWSYAQNSFSQGNYLQGALYGIGGIALGVANLGTLGGPGTTAELTSTVSLPSVRAVTTPLSNEVGAVGGTSIKLSDEAFVHVTTPQAAERIISEGLNPAFSGYVTRWKYVKNVTDPSTFNTMLYRRALWSEKAGKFDQGAAILRVNSTPQYLGPRTNWVNGIPQWRFNYLVDPYYIQYMGVIK